jgi:NADPH-dependent curcumin reductase CurA
MTPSPMSATNRQFRLAARPKGLPKREDWRYVEEPIGEPSDGEVLVETLYLSLDPAMRGWMNEARSYIAPVAIGDVMRAGGVGRVLASRDRAFAPGLEVRGSLGVQTHAIVPATALTPIDSSIAPLPRFLGTLGMPGMTAYFGLLDVGRPTEGDTVVVSAAAGAVGSVVGQIAGIKGCRVIGIAGGPKKCSYVVDELGFDAAIDYKSADVARELRQHCPSGVNVYFDNVGGTILDEVLRLLALNARVVICGAISQYNSTAPIRGPANYMSLLVNRASMRGMLVFDYAERYSEAAAQLAEWDAAGKLKSREDIVVGFERFPEALLMLFSGENFGKLVLQVQSAAR